MRLPTRQPIAGGRSGRPQPRRRGVFALVNRWRVLGVLVAIASATGINWLLTSHSFDLDPSDVEVSSLVYTQPEVIRAAIGLPEDAAPNVFRIDTRSMRRALEALPAVARADVHVTLPDRLVVDVAEREGEFALATDTGIYLVAENGFVLYALPPGDISMLTVPTIEDRRDEFSPEIEVGGTLDAVSLNAILRLAAVTPALIGSQYPALALTVDDAEGYVLTAGPDGWRAVFGHYTPNLRPVDLIDRQVQCLRARVEAGEQGIAVIYLATLDDRCGTFLPDGTPVETAPPSPPA